MCMRFVPTQFKFCKKENSGSYEENNQIAMDGKINTRDLPQYLKIDSQIEH